MAGIARETVAVLAVDDHEEARGAVDQHQLAELAERGEAPGLGYGTAPMPVAGGRSELYGAGFTTGDITGIPKGSPHPAAAWELIKYLATNTEAQVELEQDLEAAHQKSDALGKALDAAEEKHPPKPDHADDGGVF